jgi:DNA-binding winged helix-turn-helix (wHTH) protein
VSVKVITGPVSQEELVAIFSQQEFEGLMVAGVRDPDPLTWVFNLRSLYPGRTLPIAILHSPAELGAISLTLAARRFREMEVLRHPEAREGSTILIDQPGRRVVVNGTQKKLSPVEFRLLLFLIRYSDIVFSREELLHRTRSSKIAVDPRIIDVLIGRLRSKIDDMQAGPSHFTTLHGIGYRFLRHADDFIDGFTGRPFESWTCCPDSERTAPASQSIHIRFISP